MSKNTQRQQQAIASRQRLLDAATLQFEKHGYKGTTIRAINQSADLADGLLYHYFPGGKKEIFQEIVRSKMKQMMTDIYAKVQTEDYFALPIDAALEYAYVSFCEEIGKYTGIIRLLLKEKEVLDFIPKEEVENLCKNREPWLMELLRRKIASGELRDMDVEMAAFSVNSILTSQAMMQVGDFGERPLEDKDRRKRLIDYQVSLWSR